jgi:hypothetical protein
VRGSYGRSSAPRTALSIVGADTIVKGIVSFVSGLPDIYLNGRLESPHQPPRQHEQRMPRFISPGQAQRFLTTAGHLPGFESVRRQDMKVIDNSPLDAIIQETRFDSVASHT